MAVGRECEWGSRDGRESVLDGLLEEEMDVS